jgi:glucosamine--fructose-6-phosphate aminotransferase (isomerizing)
VGGSVVTEPRLHMEIAQQPVVLQGLLNEGRSAIERLAREIKQRGIAHVLIAARGTSDNAGVYAKYLLSTATELAVGLAAPSLYTLYNRPPRLTRDTLVLGISQSGMSPDIVAVLQNAREQGIYTAAMVNNTASRMAEAAECVVPLAAGEERAVAATKSYTAQLMAVAMLAAALSEEERWWQELELVPQAVRAALDLEQVLARRTERYRFMDQCVTVSRGYNYATALESALKIKELTHTSVTGYSAADFLHGPISIVRNGYPVMTIACQGPTMDSLRQLIGRLGEAGAEQIIVTDDADTAAPAELKLVLPVAVPEWLSPIPAIIPAQLLGYHLALAHGLDPDNPKGLDKVTETR